MRTCLGGRLGHHRKNDPIPEFPKWGFYTGFKGQTPGRFTIKDGRVYVLLKVIEGDARGYHIPSLPIISHSMNSAGFSLYQYRHYYTGTAKEIVKSTNQLVKLHPNTNVRILRWKYDWEWVRSYDPPGSPRVWLPKILDHLEVDWPKK